LTGFASESVRVRDVSECPCGLDHWLQQKNSQEGGSTINFELLESFVATKKFTGLDLLRNLETDLLLTS
jgi:hypothetical protein